MKPTEIEVSIMLSVRSCSACGIVFAMPRLHLDRLVATGGTFWCPNGHKLHFSRPRKTKAPQLPQTPTVSKVPS